MVNPRQTSKDDVLSKKTKTSCEDDVLNLVDEEIECRCHKIYTDELFIKFIPTALIFIISN
jgi:hypothetical protein